MTEIQISLPKTLNEWVEAQVRAGRYVDAGDYLRDLIRHDQKAADDLLQDLAEGEASGISSRSLDDIWQSAKAKVVNG